MTSTTECPTEKQAVQDLHELDFRVNLNFAEGDITKWVRIIDPETTVEQVVSRLRAAKSEIDSPKCGGNNYADILCPDVPHGKIKDRRNGKIITILEFGHEDGFIICNDVEIDYADGRDNESL